MPLESFGPWTTSLTTGSRMELSAFWQRRLTRLAAVSRYRPAAPRRHLAGLLALALLMGLLPMLKAENELPVENEPAPVVAPAAAPELESEAAPVPAPAAQTSDVPQAVTVQPAQAPPLVDAAVDAAVAAASDARLTPQVRAIRRVQRSVVNIHTERKARSDADDRNARTINGMGSGIVVDERGYIVTNQSVIAETVARRVTLDNGSSYVAEIISYDPRHDLAIIKIEPVGPLPVAPFGTSSGVLLGETVMAIGNPFGYENSISQGIISGLLRDVEVNELQSYKNLLQTDAAINPGNSGGPLVNLDGEVIGINVAIRAGAQRIGFAIPIDGARTYIANLLDVRKLEEIFHGLATRDTKTPRERKLVVIAADANSPAAAAGFLPGDIITQVGTRLIVDRVDLERALIGQTVGTAVEFVVEREGRVMRMTLRLEKAAPQGPRRRDEGRTSRPARPFDTGTGGAHLLIPDSRVIGIDVLIPAGTEQIEFASPSEGARKYIADTRIWAILGLKLEKAPASVMKTLRTNHNGGLKVIETRTDSPAAKHGMKVGDVLIGLNGYETLRPEDVTWVLDNKLSAAGQRLLRFRILRRSEVMQGDMLIASPVSQ